MRKESRDVCFVDARVVWNTRTGEREREREKEREKKERERKRERERYRQREKERERETKRERERERETLLGNNVHDGAQELDLSLKLTYIHTYIPAG